MDLDFTNDEITRYSRHILLREVGGEGQARLRSARVLLVGAGGLGSPLVLYLAAAGVGTIGLVDDDRVELSNLQRQIAHSMERLGEPKVHSAEAAARAINPEVRIVPHQTRLAPANAREIIDQYDIVCDGSDNFATRFLVADTCVLARRTLVSAAVLRFDGQLSTFKPHADPDGPCYRCLYPEAPPEGLVPSCSEAGILGAVTGVMGTLQATEVLKEVMGIGESLSGRLLIWDALTTRSGRFDCGGIRPAGSVVRKRGMAALAERFGVLLISGGHERAHYAFMLAAGAAAIGREVVVFATNEGCRALMRNWSAMADSHRDSVVRAQGVAGFEELRDAVGALGGRLMACDAGLLMIGENKGALLAEAEVSGIPTFLSVIGTGQIVTL